MRFSAPKGEDILAYNPSPRGLNVSTFKFNFYFLNQTHKPYQNSDKSNENCACYSASSKEDVLILNPPPRGQICLKSLSVLFLIELNKCASFKKIHWTAAAQEIKYILSIHTYNIISLIYTFQICYQLRSQNVRKSWSSPPCVIFYKVCVCAHSNHFLFSYSSDVILNASLALLIFSLYD